MRISDWSSDVCSSDLALVVLAGGVQEPRSPAERHRTGGASGAGTAYVGQVGVPVAVEVGVPSEISTRRVDGRAQRLDRLAGRVHAARQHVTRVAPERSVDKQRTWTHVREAHPT